MEVEVEEETTERSEGSRLGWKGGGGARGEEGRGIGRGGGGWRVEEWEWE